MFTVNEMLESWLTVIADVEARPGGKYELFWDPENRENNSTIGCRITALEKDKFIAFEWKGPTQFKHFMNNVVPLTHVLVFFIPCTEGSEHGTEVHLIHTGWGKSDEWEQARTWFAKAWQAAFDRLQKTVNIP
jgi:uncharacterized protein YndB with AHSA1/START domain